MVFDLLNTSYVMALLAQGTGSGSNCQISAIKYPIHGLYQEVFQVRPDGKFH